MFDEVVIAAVVAILLVCFKLWKRTKYWKNKDVPCVEPRLIFGNMSNVVFKRQPMAKFLEHLYVIAGNRRYFGAYYFMEPCIVLKDLDLIKQVTIKHFQSFPVHSVAVSEKTDPILNNTLLVMQDYEKWRKLRTTISPAFTGSKIKTMFKTMNECAVHLTDYIEENGDAFEIKSLFKKYSTDVIGNCVVGTSCNSFQDPNNEFLHLAHETMASVNSFRAFVHGISTVMAEVLNVRLLKKEYADYWVTFVNKIIASRENGLYKDDMLQLLLKVKHGQLRNDEGSVSHQLTNEDISSQLIMLFLAGHDTSSIALTFAAYELAINFDVQLQLQQEIDVVLSEENGNFITYESLMEMKYLDAVVSEILRKWPVVTYTERRSKKDFVIDSNAVNEKPLTLECGTKVWIPIYAIHRDPKHYPDPEKFDPRRFLPENKSKINAFSYLPFGLGPRSCLGSRFGILEIKLLLFHILSKFSIVPVENTPVPLTIKGIFLLDTKEDCSVAFEPRK